MIGVLVRHDRDGVALTGAVVADEPRRPDPPRRVARCGVEAVLECDGPALGHAGGDPPLLGRVHRRHRLPRPLATVGPERATTVQQRQREERPVPRRRHGRAPPVGAGRRGETEAFVEPLLGGDAAQVEEELAGRRVVRARDHRRDPVLLPRGHGPAIVLGAQQHAGEELRLDHRCRLHLEARSEVVPAARPGVVHRCGHALATPRNPVGRGSISA